MKENKGLKDLLTTGVIVEVYNEAEEECIRYGVVMGDIILYDDDYDSLDTIIELTESGNSYCYIYKIYSPNKKCSKIEELLDICNSYLLWEKEEKPNRLTREEFVKLPFGTKIIGIKESKNMEELEFVKIRDYYTDHAVLCLSNYKTYDFFEFGSTSYYLKEEYEEYKKELTNN